jgi:hypothetical protein
MKYLKIVVATLMAMVITSPAISAMGRAYSKTAQGQSTNQSTALERGYRTGYSDGYSAGSRDVTDRASRDYQSKEEYQRGDRSYNEAWGTAEDYRDGYQQGFEVGYAGGYDRRAFNSSIPTGLTRREKTMDIGPTLENNNTSPTSSSSSPNNQQNNSGGQGQVGGPLTIPQDSILVIELESSLSTEASQQGDRFQARVVDPREFAGAIIEGRVTRVKRPGKVKGTAELQLSFETIRMDNHTSGFRADVISLVDNGNRDGAGTVDSEGGVKGKSSTKDNVSKIGASTGIGAAIGALLGGGKGAAIGAAIGGTVGTASVLKSDGKDLRLERGQQLRIRTATETRIQ